MTDETCKISLNRVFLLVFFLWTMAEQVHDIPDNKLLTQIGSTLLCSVLLCSNGLTSTPLHQSCKPDEKRAMAMAMG
jgi:hypothetical protein